MIKSELIQKVAQANQHLYQRDVETIVNVILDEITDALARGDRVELRGFGAFTVKHRGARRGRNPRTGAAVFVEEKFVPFFKTGKELRERLNKDMPAAAPAKSNAKKSATNSTARKSTSGAKSSAASKTRATGPKVVSSKPASRSSASRSGSRGDKSA